MSASPVTALIVLDGWGYRQARDGNAIALGKTPLWDSLWAERPHCLLSGSGTDVGLPTGQMGNSEVGHTVLGAGRVIHQDFTRIAQAIEDGSFFDNPALKDAMAPLAQRGKSLHIFGLLSPGGVHSHESQIHALVDLARKEGVACVWLHAFLDGRDVAPKSALPSLTAMQEHLTSTGVGGIANSAGGVANIVGGVACIVGRYYAMDRDNRWERIEPAYKLLVDGEAKHTAATPEAALQAAYDRNETDEFVQPTVIGSPVRIEDGDAVVFMNFRADRARQLTRSFVQPDFAGFKRQRLPKLSSFVTLTEYAADIATPCAFAPETINNSLGEYIANLGLRQLRLAETEKYAHVTFFFSGGREEPFPLEERRLIPSPKVATYDLQPEMSAAEVTDQLVQAINAGEHALVVCNYANGDMVGHTGNLAASIKAVECIDACLTRVVAALEATGGQCLITADHGNVEQLNNAHTGQAHTAHTAEPVPLVYVGPAAIQLAPEGGNLADVAPTLLALMNLAPPDEMTGLSLVEGATHAAAG
ncbi:MAG: 2,3-bisphosphoglycerate-independent phosphoglycerate mutase [Pseudomonadales bacterium]